MVRAAVAMWLKRNKNAATIRALRGFERRLNFSGMVPVVVDDGDAVVLAYDGKAALHVREACERAHPLLHIDLQLIGDRDRGKCVEHVVYARHAHVEDAELVTAMEHLERRGEADNTRIFRSKIGLRG